VRDNGSAWIRIGHDTMFLHRQRRRAELRYQRRLYFRAPKRRAPCLAEAHGLSSSTTRLSTARTLLPSTSERHSSSSACSNVALVARVRDRRRVTR
jgi:hypothetical protein